MSFIFILNVSAWTLSLDRSFFGFFTRTAPAWGESSLTAIPWGKESFTPYGMASTIYILHQRRRHYGGTQWSQRIVRQLSTVLSAPPAPPRFTNSLCCSDQFSVTQFTLKTINSSLTGSLKTYDYCTQIQILIHNVWEWLEASTVWTVPIYIYTESLALAELAVFADYLLPCLLAPMSLYCLRWHSLTYTHSTPPPHTHTHVPSWM